MSYTFIILDILFKDLHTKPVKSANERNVSDDRYNVLFGLNSLMIHASRIGNYISLPSSDTLSQISASVTSFLFNISVILNTFVPTLRSSTRLKMNPVFLLWNARSITLGFNTQPKIEILRRFCIAKNPYDNFEKLCEQSRKIPIGQKMSFFFHYKTLSFFLFLFFLFFRVLRGNVWKKKILEYLPYIDFKGFSLTVMCKYIKKINKKR